MSSTNEASLTDEELQRIAIFADAPPPAIPSATDDDVREIIAFLAGSLKAPRTGLEQGKIKLGAYRLALRGIPKAGLQKAAHSAIMELEWMPAPSELRKLALDEKAPETLAHERAQAITRKHRQRQFEETLDRIKARSLSADELQAISDRLAQVAETRGEILIRLDGSRCYRTAETIQYDAQEREDALPEAHKERIILAREAAKAADVGGLAAGILAGMEVDDGLGD